MIGRSKATFISTLTAIAFVAASRDAIAQDRPIVQRCAQADESARVVKQYPATLPDTARAHAATGRALVKVIISDAGRVLDAAIYRSSGYPMLDAFALSAARASTFAPQIVSCHTDAGAVLLRYDFK